MGLIRREEYLSEDTEWGGLTWFASGKQGNSAELTTGICRIRPGLANPRHFHPNCEEVLHVLEGEIEHSLGSDRFRMSAGETVSIPRGVLHNAVNTGTGDCVLLICFSTRDRLAVGE